MAKGKKTASAEKPAAVKKAAPVEKAVTAEKPAETRKAASARKAAPVKKAAAAVVAALFKKTEKPAATKAKHKAGLRKKYIKKGSTCMVTFTLPQAAAPDAESVFILGEFNGWATDAHPLKKMDEGAFEITLELEAGRSYRFRYMIDGWKYENDWFADRYEPNPYGGEDSVVDV